MQHPPMFSLHSVNLQFFLTILCNFSNIFVPSDSFFGLMFSVRMEKSRLVSLFLLSDLLSEAIKLKKSVKVINILNAKRGIKEKAMSCGGAQWLDLSTSMLLLKSFFRTILCLDFPNANHM